MTNKEVLRESKTFVSMWFLVFACWTFIMTFIGETTFAYITCIGAVYFLGHIHARYGINKKETST